MQGGLTRRRFVAGTAGTAAAVALGGAIALGRKGSGPERRVIVVGAGLAGLTAAYELSRNGFEVVVLEARDRIGGRVLTVREPFAGGQHAEAGGEYVDTPHRAVQGYAREFGLGLEDVRGGWGVLVAAAYVRGRRRRWAELTEWPAIRPFYARLDRLSRPIDPQDPAAGGADLDGRAVSELIERAGVRDDPRLVLETWIRDDYGAEASELSLLGFAAAEKAYRGVPDRGIEAFRIRGGNAGLAAELAHRSGAEIRLASPVTAIARDDSGVEVKADGETLDGSWCVLAAPLPALRAIAFEPALPEALAGAVAEMQYARVIKTLVQYRNRFWRRLGWSGDLVTDLPMGSAWEATDRQRGRRGILISYAAGRAHDRLAETAGGDEPAAVEDYIDRAFPRSAELALGAEAHDWAADPYAGGAGCRPRRGRSCRTGGRCASRSAGSCSRASTRRRRPGTWRAPFAAGSRRPRRSRRRASAAAPQRGVTRRDSSAFEKARPGCGPPSIA